MNKIDQATNKIQSIINRANSLYDIELPNIEIKYDLKGLSAGQAICKTIEGIRYYSIRLNIDILHNEGYDTIINDTIPHEIAHIVMHYIGQGFNHNAKWKKLCIDLGGTGKRLHDAIVTKARKTKQFEYKTTCGKTIVISLNRHNKIQNGIVYRIEKGGYIIPESFKQLL